MAEELLDHLVAVYEFLDKKRLNLKREYDEAETTLAGIRREITKLRDVHPMLFPESERPERKMYQNISMRWAVLWFLNEESSGPAQTSQIADALRAGGIAERPNFNSIVSAILSQMVGKGEIEKADTGVRLTPHGIAAWDAIRRSAKFLNRHSVAAVEGDETEGD